MHCTRKLSWDVLLQFYAKLNRKIQVKFQHAQRSKTLCLGHSNTTKLKKKFSLEDPGTGSATDNEHDQVFLWKDTTEFYDEMPLLNTQTNYRSPRGVRWIIRISFFNLSELMGAEEKVFFFLNILENFGTFWNWGGAPRCLHPGPTKFRFFNAETP